MGHPLPAWGHSPGPPHLSDTVQVSLPLGPSAVGSAPSICEDAEPGGTLRSLDSHTAAENCPEINQCGLDQAWGGWKEPEIPGWLVG